MSALKLPGRIRLLPLKLIRHLSKLFASLLLVSLSSWPLRAVPESFGAISLTEISPRIVTPNGDMVNDVIFFRFDSTLSGIPIDASVIDVNGAKVSALRLSSDETNLTWDGKDENGRTLPAGIYIYSIKIGMKLATGTLVVAR